MADLRTGVLIYLSLSPLILEPLWTGRYGIRSGLCQPTAPHQHFRLAQRSAYDNRIHSGTYHGRA